MGRWYLCGNCEWGQHRVLSREPCMCQCHGGRQLRRRRGIRRGPTSRGRRAIIVRLVERDGDRCFWCKIKLVHPWVPTIEHYIPRAHGGGNNIENLVLACWWCNQKRGTKSPHEFRLWLKAHWVPPHRRRTG